MMSSMGYPGGKSKTFHQIVNLLPPHEIYIEPFLGSAAVLRAKRPAKRDIGIEIEPAVCAKLAIQYPAMELVHGDGISFLKNFPFAGNEVIYCDPPYLPCTRSKNRLYKYDLTEEHHVELLQVICQVNAKVMISGYENDLYNDVLSSWSTHQFLSKTHHGVREEFLWFNYDRPTELHDYRYLGSNFRERQTIQRRIHRMKNRLCAITPQERALMAEWLREEAGKVAG